MSPGFSIESCPEFAHIGLRENTGKNLNQVTCPDWESNPDQLVSRPDALAVTPQVLQCDMVIAQSVMLRSSVQALRKLTSIRFCSLLLAKFQNNCDISKTKYLLEIGYISVAGVPEFCPARVLLHANKSTDMSLSHLNTLKCHRPRLGSNPQPQASAISTTLPRATPHYLLV
ncbi:hypothetical protein ANN_09817 [Periplaneta americana]|uniref:Uncharacterized protein n=1 Tax=Periplaneta americana TaxID=6978 RepID=A0ABQ8TMS3_PERAM|nr:hypothetical protein ANN_09817 [Periplaneta americana]